MKLLSQILVSFVVFIHFIQAISPPACFLSCSNHITTWYPPKQKVLKSAHGNLTFICANHLSILGCLEDVCKPENFIQSRDHLWGTCWEHEIDLDAITNATTLEAVKQKNGTDYISKSTMFRKLLNNKHKAGRILVVPKPSSNSPAIQPTLLDIPQPASPQVQNHNDIPVRKVIKVDMRNNQERREPESRHRETRIVNSPVINPEINSQNNKVENIDPRKILKAVVPKRIANKVKETFNSPQEETEEEVLDEDEEEFLDEDEGFEYLGASKRPNVNVDKKIFQGKNYLRQKVNKLGGKLEDNSAPISEATTSERSSNNNVHYVENENFIKQDKSESHKQKSKYEDYIKNDSEFVEEMESIDHINDEPNVKVISNKKQRKEAEENPTISNNFPEPPTKIYKKVVPVYDDDGLQVDQYAGFVSPLSDARIRTRLQRATNRKQQSSRGSNRNEPEAIALNHMPSI